LLSLLSAPYYLKKTPKHKPTPKQTRKQKNHHYNNRTSPPISYTFLSSPPAPARLLLYFIYKKFPKRKGSKSWTCVYLHQLNHAKLHLEVMMQILCQY